MPSGGTTGEVPARELGSSGHRPTTLPACPPPSAAPFPARAAFLSAGDTLRETILLLESEVSSMEQRMNSAKTEAQALKKKLDDVSQLLGRAGVPGGRSGAAPDMSGFSTAENRAPLWR